MVSALKKYPTQNSQICNEVRNDYYIITIRKKQTILSAAYIT